MLYMENIVNTSRMEIVGAIEMRRAKMEELIGEIEFLERFTGGEASGGRQRAAANEMVRTTDSEVMPPCGAGDRDKDEKTLEELCRKAEEVLSRLTYSIKELHKLKCVHHFIAEPDFQRCSKCGEIELYEKQ